MNIETRFAVGQRLYIIDNGYMPCRVVKVSMSGKNLIYEVEYWVNAELKVVTLYEEELSSEPLIRQKIGDFQRSEPEVGK